MADLVKIVDLKNNRKIETKWATEPKSKLKGSADDDNTFVASMNIEIIRRRVATLKAQQSRLEGDIGKALSDRRISIATRIPRVTGGAPVRPGNVTMRDHLKKIKAKIESEGTRNIERHISKLKKAIARQEKNGG
jgi:hypothetical protein